MLPNQPRSPRLLLSLLITACLTSCAAESPPSGVRSGQAVRAPAFAPNEIYTIGQIDCMDASPSLRLVAMAEHSGRVLVWDWSTGRVVHELAKDKELIASPILVKFVEAHDTLVVMYNSGAGRAWNIKSGQLEQRLSFDGHLSMADAASGSAGDLLVLTYSQGGHSVFAATDTRTPRRQIQGEAYGGDRSALSANGELLLHVSSRGPATVRSIASGEVIQRFQFSKQVMCAAFSADGRFIATGNYVGQVNLWNLETGDKAWALEQRRVSPRSMGDRGKRVVALCFTEDGSHLAALRGSSVSTWNLDSGERVDHWDLGTYTGGLVFAGAPGRLVAGTREAVTLLRAGQKPEPLVLGAEQRLARKQPTIADQDALLDAVRRGDTEVVARLLRDGADANARDNREMAALWLAAQSGRSDLVKQLIDGGARVNARSLGDSTALWIAAQKGHTTVVRGLLEAEADPNLQDRFGGTALQWAASRGHIDAVRLLLANGADVNLRRQSIGDNPGATALSMAVDAGQTEVVKLLEAAGAQR